MDQDTARLIVIAIELVGVIAWLGGLAALVRARREIQTTRGWDEDRQLDPEFDDSSTAIRGEHVLTGDPEALSSRLASLLASQSVGIIGPVKILKRDARQVVFEPNQAIASRIRGGVVSLTPKGSSTTLRYRVNVAPSRLLPVGWAVLLLGLLALVVMPIVQFQFVVESMNPQVRFQSIQTVQVVHVLWPPYLLAFVSVQPLRQVKGWMDSMINNLPYL